MDSSPSFNIKVSAKQADIIVRALDLYSRVQMGQLKDVAYVATEKLNSELAQELKRLEPLITGLPHNAYHGIFSPQIPQRAKIAWDIQQAIRHKVSWTLFPEGGITVNFDTPIKCSDETLPTITSE
jgi:hypothetical protein